METTKSTSRTKTILDQANEARASLRAAGDPPDVRIAVDGVCPTDGCGQRIVVDVRQDLDAITCPSCGSRFDLA